MNLFEISSSDEEIENLIKEALVKNSQPSISIDSLVETREKENEYLDFSKEDEESKSKIDIPKKPEVHKTVDGSIFTEKRVQFPETLLSKIRLDEGSQSINLSELDTLPDWFLQAVFSYPEKIEVNDNLIYRMLYQLSVTSNEEYGEAILKLIDFFPPNFLEFSKIFQLTKLIIASEERLAIYALILLNSKYIDSYDSNLLEFSILIIGGILSTSISSHHLFFHLPCLLIDALSSSSVTKEDEIILSEDIFDAIKEVPIEAVGSLVSFLPMEEVCSGFTLDLSLKLELYYLELPEEGTVTKKVNTVISKISKIKGLCEEGDYAMIQKASAIIALLERIIVLSTKFAGVDKKKINRAVNELKMGIYGKHPDDLTIIKEQLHLTRVHIENISKETFGNIPVEVDPWI